jgi:DNA-binding transcriptional ArsR family regulator
MQDVAVIEDAAAAEVSLDPIRARMLAELAEPHTATTLAARLGLARQKVNYHVKTLEQHGLVELVEERRKGNMTERVVRASAAAYVISPAALATVAPDPARSPARARRAPRPGDGRAHQRGGAGQQAARHVRARCRSAVREAG